MASEKVTTFLLLITMLVVSSLLILVHNSYYSKKVYYEDLIIPALSISTLIFYIGIKKLQYESSNNWLIKIKGILRILLLCQIIFL
jgi:hypothetical protein